MIAPAYVYRSSLDLVRRKLRPVTREIRIFRFGRGRDVSRNRVKNYTRSVESSRNSLASRAGAPESVESLLETDPRWNRENLFIESGARFPMERSRGRGTVLQETRRRRSKRKVHCFPWKGAARSMCSPANRDARLIDTWKQSGGRLNRQKTKKKNKER